MPLVIIAARRRKHTMAGKKRTFVKKSEVKKTASSADIPVITEKKSHFTLWALLVALFAFLAFLAATYVTVLHYQKILPPCTIATGCETVLTSKYATIGPVPIALIGSIYFLGMVITAFLTIEMKTKMMARLLLAGAAAGVAVSAGLFALQAFVIKAFCQYCIFTEIMAILMLFFAISTLISTPKQKTS